MACRLGASQVAMCFRTIRLPSKSDTCRNSIVRGTESSGGSASAVTGFGCAGLVQSADLGSSGECLLSWRKHSTNPKQVYARSIRLFLMPLAHCLHSFEKVLASKEKWSCTQGVTAYEPAADSKAGSKSKKKGKGAGTYIASGASQLRANPCNRKQVAHKAP